MPCCFACLLTLLFLQRPEGFGGKLFHYESLRNEYQQTASTSLLTSGESVSGGLGHRGDEGIGMTVKSSSALKFVQIPWGDIEVDGQGIPSLYASPQSTMPSDIGAALSETEIDQLVKFLKTLR